MVFGRSCSDESSIEESGTVSSFRDLNFLLIWSLSYSSYSNHKLMILSSLLVLNDAGARASRGRESSV